MTRTTLIVASLLAIWVSPAFAQVIVTSPPVVTFYPPATPVVTYSPTVYSGPVVAPPVVASPVVVSRPVTTYYAPAVATAPVATYYPPATSYAVPTTTYAPVTTYYGGPVVAPVVGRPVVVGRSVYGTLTPYVPGQPVRNALRFTLP
jgi:hypothetical protein